MKEIWKDIKGYEGLYQVSNTGKVRSTNYMKTGVTKELRLRKDKDGYLQVNFSYKGSRKTAKVHRLVAEAFLINTEEFKQVNHKDENKENNKANNLEWCNAKYNLAYNNLRNRTASKRRRKVIQLDMNNNVINKFNSIKEAQEKTGAKNISACCNGVYLTSGGFKWKCEVTTS